MDGQRRRGRPTRRHPSTTTSASTTLIAAAAAAVALLLSILGAAHAFQPPPPPPSLSSPPPLIPTARVPWPLHAAGAAGAGPADSTAAAAAVRERLVDGEREGTLVVSTGRFPLIGLPAWSLPLHVGVLLSVEEKRKARKGRDEPGGGYFLYDFVPAEPTAPSTAVKLFSGGRVPGLVREKLLVAAAPKVVTRRGRCRRSLIEIRAFCQCYDAQLSLLGNNCGTFVDALLEFVLDGGEEEEAGRGWEREEQRGGGGDDDDDNDDLDDAASVLGWILGDDDD